MDEAIAILQALRRRLGGADRPGALRRRPDRAVRDRAHDRGRLHARSRTSRRVYLGVLARRTLITTNVVRVLEAANGKPIIFMPARHDHHRVQTGDGYAAYVAGQIVGRRVGVTTDEQASWWGGKGIGTVPHALIAAYGGNTVLAATRFARLGARRSQRDRARRLRERLGADGARGRARARAAALGRPARHVGASSSTGRSGTSWATSTRAASTSGSSGRCARRSTRTVSST